MKKFIKYGIIAVVALIIISVLDFVISMKMAHNYLNYIVIYEGEEYERFEGWSLDTDKFTEVRAFVGEAESKKKEPNSSVKLISVGDTTIISAKVHKAQNLYIRKGEKLKTSYNTSDLTSAEILTDDRYTEISGEMKIKIFDYFKQHENNMLTFWGEHEFENLSNIRVKYKYYPELVHNMGTISKYEDNYIFVPSAQEHRTISEDYIPIPFDPLLQDGKNQYPPILEDVDNIKEIRIVSPRYDRKISSKYYAEIVKHVNESCEKSYICSGDNNILGDVIVSFKDGSESKKIGMLMYDDNDNFCLSDVRLSAFDKYRWVYPFPFKT